MGYRREMKLLDKQASYNSLRKKYIITICLNHSRVLGKTLKQKQNLGSGQQMFTVRLLSAGHWAWRWRTKVSKKWSCPEGSQSGQR